MTGDGGTHVRTRILLVRHGETEYNAKSIFRGTIDVPLSAIGLEQARLTGLELSSTKLTSVVSSPLARALATAREIAASQSERMEPVIDAAFTDLNFGEWQGRPRDDVAAAYPELLDRWMREPHRVQLPNGEALSGALARAAQGLEHLLQRYRRKTFCVVSHRVIIKLLILRMLGLPVSDFWRIHIDTCGITEFNFRSDTEQFILVRHNHTAHLLPLRDKVTTQDF